MEIYDNPGRELWSGLCARATAGDTLAEERVRGILSRVREGGDAALRAIAEEIEGSAPEEFRLSEDRIAAAEAAVSPQVKAAIEAAYANIHAFHHAQMPRRIEVTTAPGVKCIQKPVAINSVGLYIPGGTAPLFSTVLMLGIPSAIALCRKRILCTPAGKDGRVSPEVIYAAKRCGIDDIFMIGGAQAVAAMAYGTETVPKVDKIFGPGNRYVTTAKKLVSAEGTAIDMPAGPSEVMVLADSSAVPAFVAADLLSQAEHGRDSQAVLVCNDASFARKVLAEVDAQARRLSRGEFVESSLGHSRCVVFDDMDTMLEFADAYAPEHLILSVRDAAAQAEKITTAGSVFIGNYSPESAGDYASGTNHTLPTSGWGRSFSGVNIDSFMRKMTLQELTPKGLAGLAPCITEMAAAEGLDAHAAAVTVRLQEAAEGASDAAPASFDLDSKVRPNILALCPYSTARDDYKGSLGIFLDANESPYENGFNRYPDPHQKLLKEQICAIKGFKTENLFLGNGSDEAIDLVFRVFCNPGVDNVVAISPSYGMYKVAAATNDIECREVPLGEGFSLDSDALLKACDCHTKAIFLCSPNNPSGNAFPRERILQLVRAFDGIVVVDEAYIDFSSVPGCAALVEEYPNLIVLQTLSKARGLAGLRIGLAISNSRIIRLMSMVKYPYNISKAAMETAMSILREPIDGQVSEIIEGRAYLSRELLTIPCVRKVWPSDANFLLVQFDDADLTYDLLTARGIIVRNRSRVPGCSGCLRITVGTPQENRTIMETLRNI